MNKNCLQFIMNNRISGFQHPTRENIMGLFHKVFRSEGGVKEQVAQYFRELNGEQGFLNDNDLMNLRYTLVNDCFYFCEYLLGTMWIKNWFIMSRTIILIRSVRLRIRMRLLNFLKS